MFTRLVIDCHTDQQVQEEGMVVVALEDQLPSFD
jgi:hypothetical protein